MTEQLERLNAALDGRYVLRRAIGRGASATVYLADDVKHERQVALKVLRPELSAALGTERFLREIKITARLNHPNILPLLDSGEAAGSLFFAMPFVEGESLRRTSNPRTSCFRRATPSSPTSGSPAPLARPAAIG